ncbi:MAG: hypothetical protein K6E75_04410 [Lachnospiraceae bacterium]|nr:hypothetical protein [Lachnospiraceae bacterium]
MQGICTKQPKHREENDKWKKETLKKMLAEYIIIELVVSRLEDNKDDKAAQRMYEYYKMMAQQHHDEDNGNIDKQGL